MMPVVYQSCNDKIIKMETRQVVDRGLEREIEWGAGRER